MLKTVVGVPRSGKSYYVVSSLIKYCDYDPFAKVYDTKPRHLIVTNIDGLKLNHKTLIQFMDEAIKLNPQHDLRKYPQESTAQFELRQRLTALFDVEIWQRLSKKYDKIVIAIDECQRYFPSFDRTIPNSVWYWFEYHGHFGADIFIMTQNAESIHKRILAINETFLEAQPPSLRLNPKVIVYNQRDATTNEKVGQQTMKLKKEVFNAYKSARHEQGTQERETHLVKYAAFATIAVVAFVIGFNVFTSNFGSHATDSIDKNVKSSLPETPEQTKLSEKITHKRNVVSNQVPAKATGLQTTQELNRKSVLRWSQNGIHYNEIDLLPEVCEMVSDFIKCPPYSIPSQLRKVAFNYICSPGKTSCMLYFPINKDQTQTESGFDFDSDDEETNL